MGIFKRKKQKIKTKVIEVRMPMLVRQVIYDSVFESAEKIADVMGLPPISEEVADMENRASEERLMTFQPLIPFIEQHAEISAQVAATAYKLEMLETSPEDSQLVEEDMEHIVGLFKIVALSSAVSCISTLISLGLLDSEVSYE
jgi:hypothetical protein